MTRRFGEGPLPPEVRNKSRIEKEPKTVELSPEEVLGFFTSPKFIDALSAAALRTKSSGHETGFRAYFLPDKTVMIPAVREGFADKINYTAYEMAADVKTVRKMDGEKKLKQRNVGNFFSFHFHPESYGAIIPSVTDLVEEASLGGIGKVDENGGKIEILIVRVMKGRGNVDLKDYDDESIDAYSPQEYVIQALKNSGFESHLILFTKRRRGYELDAQSKDVIIKEIRGIKMNLKTYE